MIGILTEKPSAARNFAKALGGMSGTYKGEQYQIVAARGHLYEFKDPSLQVAPALQAQYKSWDVKHLPWNEGDFAWERAKKKDTSDVLKTLKTVLSKCDEVVIGTDVDPTGEGQLIAWEILAELKIRPKKVSRMYFTDEAEASIQKAFSNRKVLPAMKDDPEYVKSQFRSQWDFLSMQFTRIASSQVGNGKVVRQGRLKSAMVLLVGDQLSAIKAYKKVPFYQNKFKDENGVIYTNVDEPLFRKKAEVPTSYYNSDVIVDSKTRKSTAPPKLLDLAGLSSILSSKGIKAKTVLATYQKMYEDQIVSYPRTEDKTITPEQFNELLPLVDDIAKVVGVDVKLLTHRSARKTHVKASGAHGANRPGTKVPKSLGSLSSYGVGAQEIYVLLAQSYLAMLAPDYEYENQKGHLKDYPAFKGDANVPLVLGYKAITSKMDDEDVADDSAGLGKNASPFIHEGFPPKPTQPSMKWLMTQLGKHDVGTGATRTSVYADVTNDKTKFPLLIEKKGKLSMAECGEYSYYLLPNTNIGDIKRTEQLMQQMKDIEKGTLSPDKCLHDIQRMVKEDIATMTTNAVKMREDLGISMTTKKFEEKVKVTGMWKGKEVSFNRTWGGHTFTDKEVKDLLAGKDIEISGLKSASGKEYGIVGRLSEQTYEKRKFVGFERVGFLKSQGVPKSWCNHDFSKDEIKALENGESVHLESCLSKAGKLFSCDVIFAEDDDGNKKIIPQFKKR